MAKIVPKSLNLQRQICLKFVLNSALSLKNMIGKYLTVLYSPSFSGFKYAVLFTTEARKKL